MKHLFLLCVVFLCLSQCAAKADWVIVKEAEIISQAMHLTNTLTIKFKGTKTKIQSSPDQSTISDSETGDQYTLFHAPKHYMLQSAGQQKQMREMMKRLKPRNGNNSEEPLKVQSTGKKEIINGYETEEFTWDSPVTKGSCWVAKDYPNSTELRNVMEKYFADAKQMATYPLPDLSTLPGVALRSISEVTLVTKLPSGTVTNASKTIVNLISAKNEALDDSEFAVPSDYTLGGPATTRAGSAGDMGDVLKAMKKQGLSEEEEKRLEQFVKKAKQQEGK